MFDVIAFDADDTLWHTEGLYSGTLDKFKQLMAPYATAEHIEQTVHQTEMRNLASYGYGIKGFALSLIEAAIELSQGRIQGAEIQKVLDLAREMLTAQVQLLEHAEETVIKLAAQYPLMLITKGDLFDQESKIARSGLGPYFRSIEIVTDKTSDNYAAILAKYHIAPERFLMVGNSLRSDILPVVTLGGRAVHIPYRITWAHENVPLPEEVRAKYVELERLDLLPALIEKLDSTFSRR